MGSNWVKFLTVGFLSITLASIGCGGADGTNGLDGSDGSDGAQGPPGGSKINVTQLSEEALAELDVVSDITGVEIASPPVVTFTLTSATGIPITGIVPYWNDSNRYVRFTMTKLVPGTNGDPDSWVAYTRDAVSNAPDYDTGSSLVDNGDGSYTFTFNTDVTTVPGVPYEPTLTHRVAGQLGSGSVPLEPQNFLYDYVPAGGAVADTRNIAVMESCNECHDDLVFHGRRFLVQYCVNCHNPDLTNGEGDFAFMIHKIHNGGTFVDLDFDDDTQTALSYAELTYPQDLRNCRKCHTAADGATPDGDNWKDVPHITACDGCHENFTNGTHTGGAQADNAACKGCHSASQIEGYHTTPNATPNNPGLLPGSNGGVDQRSITYELIDAVVGGGIAGNDVTVKFKILSDGTPLDMTNLPADLVAGDRYPTFLLAYALPQEGIAEPMDYNNIGNESGQPISVDLDELAPLAPPGVGTLQFNPGDGVHTAVITAAASQFPAGATLRAVGLQNYLRQDIDNDGERDVSCHTPAAVVAVTGDDERRTVVDSNNCAKCHEWFEGHGGNRTFNIQICTFCHVPNLSSSGRTITNPTNRGTDADIAAAIAAGTLDPSVNPADVLTWPEDAQNLKDLVHGIHSEGFRTRHYQHVRGPSREGYYDWSHITFPRGASTRNCKLCHEDDPELPLPPNLLSSTVRTTGVPDGQDALVANVQTATENVPNATDWINSPTAGSCFMCHTSLDAMAHMLQNGGLLSDPSVPAVGFYSNRSDIGTTFESCAVCHGPGKSADLTAVHNK